jgi:thiol:disulfide interchange protein
MTIMDQNGDDGIVLTEEQKRRRRARNIAIALALVALVVLFYALTITKVGQTGMLRAP